MVGRGSGLVALVVALALAVTGCGGPSEADRKADAALSKPVFAPDSVFTPRQLAAALPAVGQVGGANRVVARCRLGKATTTCVQSPGVAYASTTFGTRQRAVVRDHRQKGYWRPEVLELLVKRFSTKAAADAAWDQQVAQVRYVDGSFDTGASRTAGGQAWGTRGTGQVTDRPELGLQSVQAEATLQDVDAAGRSGPKMQVVVVLTRWGQELLTTRVVLWDAESEPGEAGSRAEQLVEDYLRRLARSR